MGKNNVKVRAIFKNDLTLDVCPIFELNERTENFEMVGDPEFSYPKEAVYEDDSFIVFSVELGEYPEVKVDKVVQ